MAEDSKPDMYYFCADHPFSEDHVTIGGMAMTGPTTQTITEVLGALKAKKTVEWDNLTKSTLPRAKNLILEFCRLLNENKAHFHLRFTSIQQVDIIHKMELTDRVKIAHLYYHLFLQRPFRFYAPKYDLHFRSENENVKHILEQMRVRIHKDSFDLYGSRHDPITSLETALASDSPVTEMVNLAVSAITYLRHKADTDLTNESQIELISFLQENISLPNLFSNSGAMEQKFSIWNDAPSLEHTGFRGIF